jgi:hypothetical protein
MLLSRYGISEWHVPFYSILACLSHEHFITLLDVKGYLPRRLSGLDNRGVKQRYFFARITTRTTESATTQSCRFVGDRFDVALGVSLAHNSGSTLVLDLACAAQEVGRSASSDLVSVYDRVGRRREANSRKHSIPRRTDIFDRNRSRRAPRRPP